jgi:hypothetical protein
MRPLVWLALVGSLLLGVGSQTVHVAGPVDVIPSGTAVNVRITHPIDADSSAPSMKFTAIVDDPVEVGGHIVIPRGAEATLEVVKVERSSNMKGQDRITLKMHSLDIARRVYPVATTYVEFKGASEGKKAAKKIIGGGAIGAGLGGLIGGGGGAAVGALAGAGTGAAITGSGKEHLSVPAETRMQFRLTNTIRVQR